MTNSTSGNAELTFSRDDSGALTQAGINAQGIAASKRIQKNRRVS